MDDIKFSACYQSKASRTLALLLAATAMSTGAHAASGSEGQGLPATAMNDLAAVGAALEFGKFCGVKEAAYPELVKFKSLAEKSYVTMTNQSAEDVRKAFETGKTKAQTAKAEFTKKRCTTEVLPVLKEYNSAFKATNETLVKLLAAYKDYSKK